MKKLILTTILTCAIATTANAGNVDAPAPTIIDVVPISASVTDWSGFYLGGAVSAESGSYQDYVGYAPINLPRDLAGTMYGAFAGYNIQRGKVVFGAEVSYSAGSVSIDVFPNNKYTSFTDVNGRVGFAAGRALIYVTAGASFGNWQTPFPRNFAGTGYNYGAGVDYLLTDRVFLGAEYLVREISGNFPNPGESFSSSINSIQVRAGLNF